MKCAFCGYEFEEREAERACEGCPLAKSCKLLRCPRCSYEFPAEPNIIKSLRRWVGKRKRQWI